MLRTTVVGRWQHLQAFLLGRKIFKGWRPACKEKHPQMTTWLHSDDIRGCQAHQLPCSLVQTLPAEPFLNPVKPTGCIRFRRKQASH